MAADGRKFCSELCLKKYRECNSQSCRLAGCGAEFLKAEGSYAHGLWFCCDEHLESDPEATKLIQMFSQENRGEDLAELERRANQEI